MSSPITIKKHRVKACLKILSIIFMVLALSQLSWYGAFAQQQQLGKKGKSVFEKANEKKNKSNRRLKRRGDKGRSNRQKLRQTRFKTRSKQGEKAYKGDITGRKVVTKTSPRRSTAGKAQGQSYAGTPSKSEKSRFRSRPVAPRFSQRRSERSGGVSGSPRSASRRGERAWRGNSAGRAISTRSRRTTFTGKGRYQQALGSGRSITRDPERPVKRRRIIPRSASGTARIRRGKSPYSAFRRQTPWEKAHKGDITGRPFRTKRTVERPVIQNQRKVRYSRQGKRGDRAYSGQTLGGFRTATRPRERAWKNDISGHKLRKRQSQRPDFTSSRFQSYPVGKRRGDRAFKGKLKGGGYKSSGRRQEAAGRAVGGKNLPGSGTQKAIRFQGNIKGGKPYKGGGSVSRNKWNNRGKPVQGRGTTRQDNSVARFQGNAKGRRLAKGGGSVARNKWNNRGKPVQGKGTTRQDNSVARFQGNVKGRKLAKGGGSVARNKWNNRGKPVQGRGTTRQDNSVARFQGNVKGRKLAKGGGSVGRNNWNNRGRPVQRREVTQQDNKVARFQGNLKGLKYYKGGGSVSRNNWNNKGRPITKNTRVIQDLAISTWKGRTKRKSTEPSPAVKKASTFRGKTKIPVRGKYDGYASYYRGDQKRKIGYEKNPSAVKASLKVRNLSAKTKKATLYTGRTKVPVRGKYDGYASDYRGEQKRKFNYKKNPSSADEALKVREPMKNNRLSADFQGLKKRGFKYVKNKSTAEDALKARAPGRSYLRIRDFQGNIKRTWKYSKKPSAADGSLKGIGPSRAAIRASNYQGNVKMSKKFIKDRHPSFKYASGKNDSNEFRKGMFNLRLFWAKLFRKNEGQPQHLKEKVRRPRFDKREQGLWYD